MATHTLDYFPTLIAADWHDPDDNYPGLVCYVCFDPVADRLKSHNVTTGALVDSVSCSPTLSYICPYISDYVRTLNAT